MPAASLDAFWVDNSHLAVSYDLGSASVEPSAMSSLEKDNLIWLSFCASERKFKSGNSLDMPSSWHKLELLKGY